MQFTYHVPTKVLFGYGQLRNLHKEQLPGKKALIVISKDNTMRQFGYLDRLTEQLDLAGVEYAVYDEIMPNPDLEQIDNGAAIGKANGCDFTIGLGGGSSMDASKAIAIMLTNPGSYWDYMGSSMGGKKPLPNRPAPIVCVTTTAGTGSEVDAWVVVSNAKTNEKVAYGTEGVTHPVIAVVDPELMMSVPPRLTAYQGFDVFFHAAESVISRVQHDVGEMFAMKAIEMVAKYLPTCVKDGSNKEAREKVAIANSLASYIMLTTSEHSMEHVLSAYHPTLAHGAGLLLICEAYFGFFIERHVCDDRFIKMAKIMGIDDADKAEDFLLALRKLKEECGVAELKMSDFGIEESELEMFAENVQKMDPKDKADPLPLGPADFLEMYRKSFS